MRIQLDLNRRCNISALVQAFGDLRIVSKNKITNSHTNTSLERLLWVIDAIVILFTIVSILCEIILFSATCTYASIICGGGGGAAGGGGARAGGGGRRRRGA